MNGKYRRRIADQVLAERLQAMGAVVVEGAKWCGKTTTCEQIAKSVLYMGDPERRDQYLAMAETEIGRLLEGDSPRLIDEWQDAPRFWDAIRHRVDHADGLGQFILTGSSVLPEKKRKEIQHSGTGRFSWVKMRPMTLWESGESTGEVGISRLFGGERVDGAKSIDFTLDEVAFLICRGGWPLAVGRKGAAALRPVRDYYKGVTESDISRFDDVPRDPDRVRHLLRSYARLQGTQSNLSAIRKDVQAHEARGLSEDTIQSYLKALRGIFVIEDASAWSAELRAKSSVRTTDTRYFTDPSVAAVALGILPANLVNDLRTFGLFFEGLAMRDLRAYMDTLDGDVRHYLDKTGLECDAVLQTWDGSLALVEIKLGGETLIEEGAATLNKLAGLMRAKGMAEPRFKMVLTAKGAFAYMRSDGVIVCPLSALRP